MHVALCKLGHQKVIIDFVIKVVKCELFILEERKFKGNGNDSHEEEGLDLAP